MVVKMKRVSSSNWEYDRFKDLFNENWKDSKKSAQVQSIYLASESDLDRSNRGRRFEDLRLRKGGLSEYTFHGTQRSCHIGHDGSKLRLCHHNDCYVCCILRESFRVDKASGGGMFGPGIYTSPYSSKADRYARNHYIKSELHAMLICEVVYNNPQPMYSAEYKTGPDVGYDCVEGIPKEYGGSLKNPEIVVYRDDAIMPIGVIMYTRQGWDPAR